MAVTEKQTRLRRRLSAAAYSLLGIAPAAAAGERKPEPVQSRWIYDASILHYRESDRITVTEPQFAARRESSDERVLSLLLTVDAISGATPIGLLPATPATAVNTVTSPSGHILSSEVGRVPTNHMSDTRVAVDASWQRPLTPVLKSTVGGMVSVERDFLSVGANGALARDFNRKNTTLSLGFSPEFDVSSPEGGVPGAFADPLGPQPTVGRRETKWVLSGMAGITQVIHRRMLMQWNYSPSFESGYLNDPYKRISITNLQGDPLRSVYERRPGSRFTNSLFWLTRWSLWEQQTLGISFRYFWDDWGIRSQTLDFTYRWPFRKTQWIEPHIRYYSQSDADFFTVGLLDGRPLPEAASADYRLGGIRGVTFGLRYGWRLPNASQLIVRAEYYSQAGDSHPSSAVGQQRDYNLSPTLHAGIFQVIYTFDPEPPWTKPDSHKRR